MNVISLNINGLGEDKKKSWIRSMVGKDSPSFLGIQETKMENIDLMFAKSLWPRDNLGFAFSNSMGASGGILSIWDSSIFTLEHKIVERNYLGTLGRWAGISRSVGFVNIYAPQANVDKEVLWLPLRCL